MRAPTLFFALLLRNLNRGARAAGVMLVFGIVVAAPFAVHAQILCKSATGGQCVDLGVAAASKAIPGLEFLTDVAKPSDLFSKIYTYGISLVALTAFFMFTYGAIRYMMPTEGGTAEAKKAMYNAVLGLVVALVSYLTLSIINPNLVKNFDINLPLIEKKK